MSSAAADDSDVAQPWWSRHQAAISGGLAVGLLVYRYAVLPFVVTSFAAGLYLWIGLGALAVARLAYQAGLGDVTSGVLGRARMSVGLVAAAVSFSAAFLISPPFGYLWLAPRAFPGFDLNLPAVGAVDKAMSTYAHGRMTVARPGGLSGAVQVSWQGGGLPDEKDAATIGRAFVAGVKGSVADTRIEPRDATAGETARKTWLVHAGSREIWMTFAACGARLIMIATTDDSGGAERLHSRVLRSLRCRADPSRDASLGDVPVVFDLGAGWSRLPTTPDQLQLTDGRVVVSARPIERMDTVDLVPALMGRSMPGFQVGAREGDHWSLEIDVDGEKQRGWLLARDCPYLGQALLLMSAGEKEASLETLAVLRGARCKREDEAPQHWPELAR